MLNTTPQGKSVCNFTVAVNRRRQQGQDHPEADFFRVAAWGAMGEACNKFLTKGKKVYVSGAVQINSYTDKDGATRANMEIPFADEVEFLSPRDGAEGQQGGGGAVAQGTGAAAPAGYTPVSGDDLPF